MVKPVVLIIRDGWGINPNPNDKGDMIRLSKTPVHDMLRQTYPYSVLHTSGEAVGLPKGYQGNSEVGHITIGAGRIINQSLMRINQSIKDKTFFKNKAFLKAVTNCNKNKSTLHLIGLIQDKGVHAHQDHLYALLKLAKQNNVNDIMIHFITDGRDSVTNSSFDYLKQLELVIKKLGFKSKVKFGTVSGRMYAMDRNKRWARIKLYFNALCFGKGVHAQTISEALEESHSRNVTDEFIKPTIINDYTGIQSNDSIIFFNYRYDRARELTRALVDNKFNVKLPKFMFVAMTQYYDNLKAGVAFKEIKMINNLAQILAKHNLNQFRIAETEKYAHVTFFFNSQVEKPVKGETRLVIPSPNVKTYDLKPEMSAGKVTTELIKAIKSNKYDFILCNYANTDMVGHTAVKKAVKKAVETVDMCIGKVMNQVEKSKGVMLIISDHGNAEQIGTKANPITYHTTFDVPMNAIDFSNKTKIKGLRNGSLEDVAPTVLDVLNLKKPKQMTGVSLIIR